MEIGYLKALRDNYIWMLTEADDLWVVDPGECFQVIEFINRQGLKLKGILITHHHFDHTAGIKELTEHFPGASVYAGRESRNAYVTHYLKEGDQLMLGKNCFKILETPGHTLDHICFCSDKILFSGDTLFTAGCGRVFEGSPEQMSSSLLKLRAMDDSIKLYCAHEYTLDNMVFARMVEPDNNETKKRYELVKQNSLRKQPCVPSTLFDEKLTNPFLRFDKAELAPVLSVRAGRAELKGSEKFAILRQWKNNT